MSVWHGLVGQEALVRSLQAIAQGDPKHIAQSWLICGERGAGRERVALAFAAALQSADHGLSEPLSRTASQILQGTHPDVTVLRTDTLSVSIDQVRRLIADSEQMPSTAPWRIIIIEDVERMAERTTNVLLKELEEPSPHAIWMLCAASAQDVLPTIRSRTRVITLATPSAQSMAEFLSAQGIAPATAAKAARVAQGDVDLAARYAHDPELMARRDALVRTALRLQRTSEAVLAADALITQAQEQAQREVDEQIAERQRQFRALNGLTPQDRLPQALQAAYHALAKKEDTQRAVTRRSREVLHRALAAIASAYRDVAIVQNSAEPAAPLINAELQDDVNNLAVQLSKEAVIRRLQAIDRARKRLDGNGQAMLVLEALFASLPPNAPLANE